MALALATTDSPGMQEALEETGIEWIASGRGMKSSFKTVYAARMSSASGMFGKCNHYISCLRGQHNRNTEYMKPWDWKLGTESPICPSSTPYYSTTSILTRILSQVYLTFYLKPDGGRGFVQLILLTRRAKNWGELTLKNLIWVAVDG